MHQGYTKGVYATYKVNLCGVVGMLLSCLNVPSSIVYIHACKLIRGGVELSVNEGV